MLVEISPKQTNSAHMASQTLPTKLKLKFAQTGECRCCPPCFSYENLVSHATKYWGQHDYCFQFRDIHGDLITVDCLADYLEVICIAQDMGETILTLLCYKNHETLITSLITMIPHHYHNDDPNERRYDGDEAFTKKQFFEEYGNYDRWFSAQTAQPTYLKQNQNSLPSNLISKNIASSNYDSDNYKLYDDLATINQPREISLNSYFKETNLIPMKENKPKKSKSKNSLKKSHHKSHHKTNGKNKKSTKPLKKTTCNEEIGNHNEAISNWYNFGNADDEEEDSTITDSSITGLFCNVIGSKVEFNIDEGGTGHYPIKTFTKENNVKEKRVTFKHGVEEVCKYPTEGNFLTEMFSEDDVNVGEIVIEAVEQIPKASSFIPSCSFRGARAGYEFKTGQFGTGYYQGKFQNRCPIKETLLQATIIDHVDDEHHEEEEVCKYPTEGDFLTEMFKEDDDDAGEIVIEAVEQTRKASSFIPSCSFRGARAGYEFKTGQFGTGYYQVTGKAESINQAITEVQSNKYEQSLQELNAMGFENHETNLVLLVAYDGRVDKVVDHILA